MDTHDIHWIAGFLEGEGCFQIHRRTGSIYISASQVQRSPLDKLLRLCGGRITWMQKNRPRGIYLWRLNGKPAIAWMMTLYGLMSPRRKAKIATIFDGWKTRGTSNGDKTHCKHGHAFSEGNALRWSPRRPTWRSCRECHRRMGRETARRRRAKIRLLPSLLERVE